MYKIPGHYHIPMITKNTQTNLHYYREIYRKGEIENGKIPY